MAGIVEKKTLVVMGNGPSLRNVDLDILRNYDTFALNCSFRIFDKIQWWPTYHGSFDYNCVSQHKESLVDLLSNENPIKKCFYVKNISNSNKFQFIDLIPFGTSNKWNSSKKDFNSFNDGGNSAINACQVGICMGYNRILLIGVDCNYVEVPGATIKIGNGKERVIKQIKNNPNYWFDEYQKVGDTFSSPQTKKFHLNPWKQFSRKCNENEINIINCSKISKLECFNVSTLSKEMGISSRKTVT